MTQASMTKQEEIKAILKEYPATYPLALAVLFTLLGILMGGRLFANEPGYVTNLYNDALSIFVTVTILDVLARRREERNRVKDLQEQLKRDASSIVNDVARNAVHQLRKRDWLSGHEGLLKGEDLRKADLQGADLSTANLAGANLRETILKEADLQKANLKGAHLGKADLEGAKLREIILEGEDLREANFMNADLFGANLQRSFLSDADLNGAILLEANLAEGDLERGNLSSALLTEANLTGARLIGTRLVGADLRGVNLNKADLRGAELKGAKIINVNANEDTILPNGERWTPDTDWTQFGAIVDRATLWKY